MPDVDDTRDQTEDVRRNSGARRRIVVDDSKQPRGPKPIGRKLSDPPNRAQGPIDSATSVRAPSYAARPTSDRSVNFKRAFMIVAGIITILVVVPAVALVFHAVRKPKPSPQAKAAAPAPPVETPVATQAPSPEPSTEIETLSDAGVPVDVEPAEVRSMVLQLASQISQKSGYEFGPEFVELIRGRAREYIDAKSLEGARQYRREINKSFRDEGLNPLIGYVLALSRSKFDLATPDRGVGIWQLPIGVARSQGYLALGESSAKLKIPETSAQIAASYTRQLLSAFDSEDFMYAIACFGMNLQEAGQLQARLVAAAPDTKSRRDIMKVIRARVLTDDQVDNIARFFAAGIVGENPQQFGLESSQPLSSLY